MIWLAWVAGIVTAALFALIVIVELRNRGGIRPHDVPGVPVAPASFVPFIAAATLITLGITFVAGNAVDDSWLIVCWRITDVTAPIADIVRRGVVGLKWEDHAKDFNPWEG